MVPVVINLITHSELIVWVHRSFPHRSGIVKTLHIVGLVEAAHGVRKGNNEALFIKDGNLTLSELPILFQFPSFHTFTVCFMTI